MVEKTTLRLVHQLVLALRNNQTGPYIWLYNGQRIYPAPFKAVLRAEEALLAVLLACWTLQGACVIPAVDTQTLSSHVLKRCRIER